METSWKSLLLEDGPVQVRVHNREKNQGGAVIRIRPPGDTLPEAIRGAPVRLPDQPEEPTFRVGERMEIMIGRRDCPAWEDQPIYLLVFQNRDALNNLDPRRQYLFLAPSTICEEAELPENGLPLIVPRRVRNDEGKWGFILDAPADTHEVIILLLNQTLPPSDENGHPLGDEYDSLDLRYARWDEPSYLENYHTLLAELMERTAAWIFRQTAAGTLQAELHRRRFHVIE